MVTLKIKPRICIILIEQLDFRTTLLSPTVKHWRSYMLD